jgi:hypothetical protein
MGAGVCACVFDRVFIHSLNKTYVIIFISILLIRARAPAPRAHCNRTIIYCNNNNNNNNNNNRDSIMGNNVSTISSSNMDEMRDMALRLDLYAQRIILKEVKFNSTLGDSGKCEKLIIITSEVLNRLPFRLISYMDRRHKLFSEKYEPINAMDRALLINTNPEILKESKLDEQNVFRKKQMCVGLARFYVQIGNLFNAVMSTMRPYNYEYQQKTMPDNFYDMLTFGLLDNSESRNKEKAKYDTYNMAGFTRRQADMKQKMDRLLKIGEIDMKIAPGSGICSINTDMKAIKTMPMSMTSSASTTTQNKIKPSIFAMLEELYFDIFHEASEVNTNTPQFIAMSERMKNKVYRRDVQELYRIVTGGKEPGDNIRTFADVSQYINDNSIISQWCEKNRGLEINVNDNVRYNPIFVKYVKHIQMMNYKITKHRKGVVKLLDRIFVVMKQNEDVLHEIEEDWAKGNFKRYQGFEQDDQYSRDFFRLNLKYNFFINPNLTDADLQVITNEARTRIVKLYAESYRYFLEGFKILQELQESLGLEALVAKKEMAKKETENLATSANGANGANGATNDISKKFDPWVYRNLPQQREFSDDIYNEIKEGTIASKYKEIYMKLYNAANTTNNDKEKSTMSNNMKRLNAYMVNNIIKNTSADITDEIRSNILAEMDTHMPNKSSDGKPTGSNAGGNQQDLLYAVT